MAELVPQENNLRLHEKLFVKLFGNAIAYIVRNEINMVNSKLLEMENRFNSNAYITQDITNNLQIVGKGLKGIYNIVQQIIAINSKF